MSRQAADSKVRTATGVRSRTFWLAIALFVSLGNACADLMLSPTRIVFEKNQRAAQLDLINNGQESATFRISLVNRRMTETGGFAAVDTPLAGERFADELLRYSPRQVVLGPGASQTVRISVRKPADLPAGEYRSHLQFDQVAPSVGSSSILSATQQTSPGEVIVQLKALVGASIPIIVRHGETAANLTLARLQLLSPAAQKQVLAFAMQRSGDRSAYGDLGVTFTPQGGPTQEVGKVAGVAVYTPNVLRRVNMELTPTPGLTLARGTLRLSYRERPEAGGKLLAEATLELP